jgi:hypothetical protein
MAEQESDEELTEALNRVCAGSFTRHSWFQELEPKTVVPLHP